MRENYAEGITRFFIIDDNFARNKDWEPLFDRMIDMRGEGMNWPFYLTAALLATPRRASARCRLPAGSARRRPNIR